MRKGRNCKSLKFHVMDCSALLRHAGPGVKPVGVAEADAWGSRTDLHKLASYYSRHVDGCARTRMHLAPAQGRLHPGPLPHNKCCVIAGMADVK